jgi:hypothetical protein
MSTQHTPGPWFASLRSSWWSRLVDWFRKESK